MFCCTKDPMEMTELSLFLTWVMNRRAYRTRPADCCYPHTLIVMVTTWSAMRHFARMRESSLRSLQLNASGESPMEPERALAPLSHIDFVSITEAVDTSFPPKRCYFR